MVKLTIGHTPNYATVTLGSIALHFSYETVIAFDTPETGLVVRVNDWSTTTGKHLNALDGGRKDSRWQSQEFESLLATILDRITVR